MPRNRPILPLHDVQGAIRNRIQAGGTLRIEDVAGELYISKSTLQRMLSAANTTFTKQRRQVQVEVALERLLDGKSRASTASYVGLSGDYLCKLVTEYTALTPRQILRACHLAAHGQRWRRSAPPRAGTRLYFKQLERWKAIDAELGKILAGLPPDGPLARWACDLQGLTRRPDYRRKAYRPVVRAERRREKMRLTKLLRQAIVAQRPSQTSKSAQEAT